MCLISIYSLLHTLHFSLSTILFLASHHTTSEPRYTCAIWETWNIRTFQRKLGKILSSRLFSCPWAKLKAKAMLKLVLSFIIQQPCRCHERKIINHFSSIDFNSCLSRILLVYSIEISPSAHREQNRTEKYKTKLKRKSCLQFSFLWFSWKTYISFSI